MEERTKANNVLDIREFQRQLINSREIKSNEKGTENDPLELMMAANEIMKEAIMVEKNRINNRREVLKSIQKDIISKEELNCIKVREEESMKREVMVIRHKRQVSFLLLAFSLIIFSFINLLLLALNKTCVNPAISIVVLLMGLGWGSTAIASMYEK